jgi:hypothetical protein
MLASVPSRSFHLSNHAFPFILIFKEFTLMSHRFSFALPLAASALVIATHSTAHGTIVPFTENFATDAANWYDNAATAPVQWVANGGPDGSSHVSTNFNFVNLPPGLPIPNNPVNLFRAQDEFNSSGGAFFGNWIADGVTAISFAIRHDGPTPLNFFARFATPNNFPAWSGVQFAPVQANTWTTITIPISLSNPALFFEGPPGAGQAEFDAVFSNIGHVQIGAFAGSLAGVDDSVRFDLDQVTLVPGPGALTMLALMGVSRRGRKRC